MKVSVIIPSRDGHRGGNLERLKEQLAHQTLKPVEIITVIGVEPNGRARNVGVEVACGDYYVFIDDDVTLGDDSVLEKLIKPFLERSDVGMTGPSQLIPLESSRFQQRAAVEIPRSLYPVQKELVDSDMVSHMCLAMPARLFKEIGWENPNIISGTDPDLRYRVRQAGYRVCVVPNCWAYHPMPESFSKLMQVAYEKGKNSGYMQRFYPELIYELDDGFSKEFPHRKWFWLRILRGILGVPLILLKCHFIYFSYRLVYFCGFIFGYFLLQKSKNENKN